MGEPRGRVMGNTELGYMGPAKGGARWPAEVGGNKMPRSCRGVKGRLMTSRPAMSSASVKRSSSLLCGSR